jgi:hypothetical protein
MLNNLQPQFAPAARAEKSRFNSRQYEGERSLTAISQNFFVVSFDVTLFSQSTAAEKESLAERVMPTKALRLCRSRPQSSDRRYRQTIARHAREPSTAIDTTLTCSNNEQRSLRMGEPDIDSASG